MKNYFLDANIIIDIISNRNLEKTSIDSLLKFIPKRNIYISTLSVHIAYYTLKIKKGTQLDRIFQTFILDINLIPLTERVTMSALKIDFNDFEDLLQYFSAVEHCDYIITRNVRDFIKIKSLSRSQIGIFNNLAEITELKSILH